MRTEPVESRRRRHPSQQSHLPGHQCRRRDVRLRSLVFWSTTRTTTSPAGVNGRSRKSLETHLDRFDSILDGLADALNESVADAVKDAVGLAVREAVQAVVAELLTNPQVVAKLAEAHELSHEPPAELTQTPAPQKPSWRERMKAR